MRPLSSSTPHRSAPIGAIVIRKMLSWGDYQWMRVRMRELGAAVN